MLSSILFFTSLAILFYVIRYRVHVHIEISSSPSRQRVKGRRAEARNEVAAPTAKTRPDFSRVQEISSALVNLQAKPGRAKAAAEHVVRNWPNLSFEQQVWEAVKEVQAV